MKRKRGYFSVRPWWQVGGTSIGLELEEIVGASIERNWRKQGAFTMIFYCGTHTCESDIWNSHKIKYIKERKRERGRSKSAQRAEGERRGQMKKKEERKRAECG